MDCFVTHVLELAEADARRRMEMRVAIYELCRNVLDHGRPLTDHAEVELELHLDKDGVGGWLRDECEFFDISRHPARDIQALAADKAPRGYGLTLVRRIVTLESHEYLSGGNRISFRIPREEAPTVRT